MYYHPLFNQVDPEIKMQAFFQLQEYERHRIRNFLDSGPARLEYNIKSPFLLQRIEAKSDTYGSINNSKHYTGKYWQSDWDRYNQTNARNRRCPVTDNVWRQATTRGQNVQDPTNCGRGDMARNELTERVDNKLPGFGGARPMFSTWQQNEFRSDRKEENSTADRDTHQNERCVYVDRKRLATESNADVREAAAFISRTKNQPQLHPKMREPIKYTLLPTKEEQIRAQLYISNTTNIHENATKYSTESDNEPSEKVPNTEIIPDSDGEEVDDFANTFSRDEFKFQRLSTTYYKDLYDLEEQRQIVRELRERDNSHEIRMHNALGYQNENQTVATGGNIFASTDSSGSMKINDTNFLSSSSSDASKIVINSFWKSQMSHSLCKKDELDSKVFISNADVDVPRMDAKPCENNQMSTRQSPQIRPHVNIYTDKSLPDDKTLKNINQSFDEIALGNKDFVEYYQASSLKPSIDLDEQYGNYKKSKDNNQESSLVDYQNKANTINPIDKNENDDPITVRNESYSTHADNDDSFKIVIGPIGKTTESDKGEASVVFQDVIPNLNIWVNNLKIDLQIKAHDESEGVNASDDNICQNCQRRFRSKDCTITVKNSSITIRNNYNASSKNIKLTVDNSSAN